MSTGPDFEGLERFDAVDATGEAEMFMRFLEEIEALPEVVVGRHSVRAVGSHLLCQTLGGCDGDGRHTPYGGPDAGPLDTGVPVTIPR